LLLALCLTGCAGADWKSKHGVMPSPLPPRTVVRVVGQVSDLDGDEPVEALTRALQEQLSDEDVSAEVTLYPQRPSPPPRIDVRVTEWDAGSRGLRFLIGLGAGAGTIIAQVRYLDPAGRPLFYGTVEGSVVGGFFGGEAASAAEAAGRTIGKAIAGKRVARRPRRPR
jgi:hypothetical protein